MQQQQQQKENLCYSVYNGLSWIYINLRIGRQSQVAHYTIAVLNAVDRLIKSRHRFLSHEVRNELYAAYVRQLMVISNTDGANGTAIYKQLVPSFMLLFNASLPPSPPTPRPPLEDASTAAKNIADADAEVVPALLSLPRKSAKRKICI